MHMRCHSLPIHSRGGPKLCEATHHRHNGEIACCTKQLFKSCWNNQPEFLSGNQRNENQQSGKQPQLQIYCFSNLRNGRTSSSIRFHSFQTGPAFVKKHVARILITIFTSNYHLDPTIVSQNFSRLQTPAFTNSLPKSFYQDVCTRRKKNNARMCL